MKSLKELENERARHAEELKMMQGRIQEREYKKKVKEDIRRIKAAKSRAKLGMTSQDIDKVGLAFKSAFKGAGKSFLQGGKMLGKGLLGAGEAAERYYAQQNKRRR